MDEVYNKELSKFYSSHLIKWEIIKKYLRLRYQLIPYLYTESYVYSKSGSPVIQPLYYKYPKRITENNADKYNS